MSIDFGSQTSAAQNNYYEIDFRYNWRSERSEHSQCHSQVIKIKICDRGTCNLYWECATKVITIRSKINGIAWTCHNHVFAFLMPWEQHGGGGGGGGYIIPMKLAEGLFSFHSASSCDDL